MQAIRTLGNLQRTDQDYENFRQHFFTRKNSYWCMLSGSLCERPLCYTLNDPTDVDMLIWPIDICAVPDRRSVPANFQGTLLTIETRDVSTGFARLTTAAVNGAVFYCRTMPSEDQPRQALDGGWKEYSKGPSWRKAIQLFPRRGFKKLHEALSLICYKFKHIRSAEIDRVEAIYCPSWPPEAAEWMTRERKNGWPPKDVIDKIIGLGCHLVPKPHQSNPGDDTQWRYSFSVAEAILINSWTDVQKYIYHVLRIIKSEVVKSCGGEDKTVLCTYFFKTLMLWACEEKPSEFWTEENLETSVGELLCMMIEWLIERCCPNYIIRKNNMIGFLADDFDLSADISSLLHYKEHYLSTLLSNAEKSYPRIELTISVPTKILNYAKLMFFVNNMLNPLCIEKSNKTLDDLTISEWLSPAFKNLYSGLSQHLQFMINRAEGKSMNSDSTLLSMANTSFTVAADTHETSSVNLSFTSSDTLLVICEKLSLFNSSRHGKTCMESSRLTSCNSSVAKSNTGVSRVLKDKYKILVSALEAILNHSSGVLVSPSYFISVAYRVNFLYTALHDYSSAIQQCERAITLLESQKTIVADRNTFKEFFPIVLTNELSPIFDEQIQTVLGFVALCQSVFSNRGSSFVFVSERRIVVRLCVREFIEYVGRQCSSQLGQYVPPLVLDHYDSITRFPKKYFLWFSQCFLHAALKITGHR